MSFTAFFTSSNPSENRVDGEDLTAIKEEFDGISQILSNDGNDINRVINKDCSNELIINEFLANINIKIFHFSGHAGDGKILLNNSTIGHASILTHFMRHSKNLQLVFLNGCSTHSLVWDFLENGAKAVIATNKPVYDHQAATFSIRFYRNLIQMGWSIIDSLIEATVFVQVQNEFPDITQAIKYRTIKKPNKDELYNSPTWGLYLRKGISDDDAKKIMNWTVLFPQDGIGEITHYYPTLNLIESIHKNANQIYPSIDIKHSKYHLFNELNKINADNDFFWGRDRFADVNELIIKLIPQPIVNEYIDLVNHSRDLREEIRQKDRNSLKKLVQLQIALYDSFVRFSIAITVSDFFESICRINDPSNIIYQNEINKLNKKYEDLFVRTKNFIEGKFKINTSKEALILLRQIYGYLEDGRNEIDQINSSKIFTTFINEINIEKSRIIMDSCHTILIEIENRIKPEDIGRMRDSLLISYCDRAESALIDLFREYSYILKYELITIGMIETNRIKRQKYSQFRHTIFTRNKEFDTDIKNTHTDNFSCVLVKDENNILDNLNLSPFLINAASYINLNKRVYYYLESIESGFLNYIKANENENKDKPKSDYSIKIKVHLKGLDAALIEDIQVLPKDYQIYSLLSLEKNRENAGKFRNRFHSLGKLFRVFKIAFYKQLQKIIKINE